jgi:GntR family transcriptional regulator
MFFRIDPSGELPIYEQIVRQVKFAVATGGLVPGQLVPSVRELAKQAAINPNTAIRAYRILQDEDVLCRLRGTGLAVTQNAPRACRDQRTEMIRLRLAQVLDEAFQSGLNPDSFLELVRRELAARDGAAARVPPEAVAHGVGEVIEPQDIVGRE